MSRYTLQPKRNNMPLVETIHETWIDAPSKAAFQALAAAQGLSMRAALAQLIEQHAQIREPFSPRRPTPWTGEAAKGRERYRAALPSVQLGLHAVTALQIDANRAGIRLTEAVRQLVWLCIQANA